MRRDDEGQAAIFLVILAAAFFGFGGLVIDGGRAVAARVRAANHAEQAARAGAAVLDEAALRNTNIARPDPTRAVAAAQAFLAEIGDRGTVTVHGRTVTVRVTTTTTTVLLGIVGVRTFDISAEASARPAIGVTTEEAS
jgi:Flp pilus assembly protein TadG